ncbi:MAG: DEAD/DEAH box helicase, partial [Clostridia bacterium]|nr:DEAD/DEAH box helicase [Clostridia bacterium]
QEQGWPAVASRRDVLISAPTGTGKTLAAFLYWLDRLGRECREQPLSEGVRVLYISPLKALGNDIRENLQKPLTGLGLQGLVRAQVRTGDTPSAERARMAKHPPQIFITTPESLYLLLTSKSGRRMLSTVECVICDELHAILDSKRGVHLAISLERLDELCGRKVQRIGLSATVRPLETAAAFLTGSQRPAAVVVAPKIEKKIDMRVEMPARNRSLLHEKSAWAAIADRVYRLSQEVRTTLAFVDGRAQAEKLAHHINIIANEEQYARTHHGCVSREQRLEAEQQLRSGSLRILCATSSMELGIDVGEIDLVVQVGAPNSIASLLQRAGRAGHGPGRTSVVRIFPKTDSDALYCALTARGALEGEIERARIPEMCLDVLAQHLVSMAAAADYTVEDALALMRRTWSYRNLERELLENVLRMLAGDYEHERELPVRPRILYDRLSGEVSGDTYTRMLACSSGGTIPDRGWYSVVLPDGRKLGELDEEFVFEARLGDKFLLGAFAWRIVEIGRDRVIVEQSTPEGAQSPFWRGDGAGRSPETGMYFGRLLRELNEAAQSGDLEGILARYPLSQEAIDAAKEHIERQIDATGMLADDRTIVLEHFPDEAGAHQLMLHCPLGKRVNRPLAMLLREEARRQTGCDIHIYDDDDGVLLYLMGTAELPDGLLRALPRQQIGRILAALLPGEPVFTMAFRYAAFRALMLGMRTGARQPLWVQRLRGAETLSAAIGQREHPLLWEANRECRQDLCDSGALQALLHALQTESVRVREIHLPAPSPMALPLRRQVEAEMMYTYSPIPSAAVRMAQQDAEQAALVMPEDGAFALAFDRPPVRSRQELHSRLMAEGDLAPDEPGAHSEWLEQLYEEGRACFTDSGLWIAAEEVSLYEHAADGDTDALERIMRRCMRFRGPQNARTLAQRYCLLIEQVQAVLQTLFDSGAIRAAGENYVHKDVFAAAQRTTIRLKRQQITTRPAERLCALLAHGLVQPGPTSEQCEQALRSLCGIAVPAEWWEGSLLPARVTGYKPQALDQLLASGNFTWQIVPKDGKMLVEFRQAEDDGDEFAAPETALSEDEQAILRVLEHGGAMFAQRIGARLNGAPVEEALKRMCALGLVRKDSFGPVRQMLAKPSGKKRMPAVRVQDTGRWERCRIAREFSDEKLVDRAFARCPILCRETISGIEWPRAIIILRRREYAGTVRRGYFIEGLSGAQFVQSDRFEALTAYLAEKHAQCACMPANDPAQLWGRVLPHLPEQQFLCVAQTAIVLYDGRPAAVFERSGEQLRIFEHGEMAVREFAQAFRAGRIFPGKRSIVVKKYPPEAAPLLQAAGFQREALDYVLERR